MAKRRTTAKPETGEKAAEKAPWCPCEDCIKPVAAGLAEIVKRWHVRRKGVDRVKPLEIEFLYKNHDVEFLTTWLKMSVSVAFCHRP